MNPIREMLKTIRTWLRRRTFQEGQTVSRFIAPDIRRDFLVISTARVDEGIITGRVEQRMFSTSRKAWCLNPSLNQRGSCALMICGNGLASTGADWRM